MNDDPSPTDQAGEPQPRGRRLYLLEPGWHVEQKVGNDREFCYMMAPGQDYYHRLYDGEIYLQRSDERLCLACAERRGLLSFSPKALREALGAIEYTVEDSASAIALKATGHDEDEDANADADANIAGYEHGYEFENDEPV